MYSDWLETFLKDLTLPSGLLTTQKIIHFPKVNGLP